MSPLLESLQLGKVPRIVGTIITSDFLEKWRLQPQKLPCDLIELRVDGFSDFPNWTTIGEEIEGFDSPVFATIRLSKEGGKWTSLDSDRWPMLENALRKLSGVDVEMASDLADLAARLAADLNKLCVLSYHNFEQTPPLSQMRQMLERAHQRGCIGKIAAKVNSAEDLANLQTLLTEPWELPICLIGMGPLGRETRLSFPLAGSCFTYGYLDIPGAPGQYSAAELRSHFQRSA